jgi:glycosyltransferase involved in cell wall biosynthesis
MGALLRIGMVTSSYPRFQGDIAGTFVRSLAESIAAMGHEVHVVAPWDPALAEPEGLAQVHRFHYAPIDSLYVVGYARSLQADVALRNEVYPLLPFYVGAAATTLWRWHARRHFDIIHAHWVVPGGAVGALVSATTNTPLVVSLHGSDVFMVEQNAIAGLTARWVFGQAQRVMGCSLDLLHRAGRRGLPEEKSTLLHYGVDPSGFQPDAAAGQQLRQQLGIAADAPVVMGLGRLVYKKGWEYLLRATPAIVERFPKARIVIAGEGPLFQELRPLAAELQVSDHVLFVGNVPWTETSRYFNMSDVVVVPSVRDQEGNVDGLPNVLLEAMSCGRPIVATRVAGLPEVITDRVNGLLVEEKDPEQLAAAVVELLASPQLAASCGAANSTKIENEMTWGQVSLRTVKVYEQAIATSS